MVSTPCFLCWFHCCNNPEENESKTELSVSQFQRLEPMSFTSVASELTVRLKIMTRNIQENKWAISGTEDEDKMYCPRFSSSEFFQLGPASKFHHTPIMPRNNDTICMLTYWWGQSYWDQSLFSGWNYQLETNFPVLHSQTMILSPKKTPARMKFWKDISYF